MIFTSDAKYKSTRSRELRPGELEQIEASVEKIKARRSARLAAGIDGMTFTAPDKDSA